LGTAPADRIGRDGFRLSIINHEQHPTFIPTANPADAPAINVIANRDFSEEPQKLGLNLHGDPCISTGLSGQGRLRPISLFSSDQQRSDREFDQERFGRGDSFLATRHEARIIGGFTPFLLGNNARTGRSSSLW
jgi:hypothetical protein